MPFRRDEFPKTFLLYGKAEAAIRIDTPTRWRTIVYAVQRYCRARGGRLLGQDPDCFVGSAPEDHLSWYEATNLTRLRMDDQGRIVEEWTPGK